MEICIVRNDHLSVLTDLEVQLESVHTHFGSLGHGRESVFRPEARTSAVSLDVHIVAQLHIEFPLLSETAADIDSHHLGILVRSCGEIMDVLLRLLERRDLLAFLGVEFLDFLDIGRRAVLDHGHRAHILAVLRPGHCPLRVIVPDIGDY